MERITGTMINYYFVCKRKLWYFIHDIQMEKENEDVQIGKLIDEKSYSREKKHITINNTISVDFIGKYNILHEVKKSKSIEEAGEWQIKYYIYYLRKKGVNIHKGIIDYPKLRQRQEVFLEKEDEIYIEKIIKEIKELKEGTIPNQISSKICKKCAYYELCYI
ncbi:CRISPR-associated protein Cas4 [Defluviitalea phaphyphila]|uniref:CRISPR-associated protein Cas4 n=1 Tax=Defluviitalea phaphyphila TaxID=1473580 RepID=UPI000ACB1B79|nr:CRISPR-associated protein Cas4 [Defluviitalea phaphyphila]